MIKKAQTDRIKVTNKQYITTPIYYVNDVPHLGHGYTTVVADTLARYWRQQNVPTYFLTGTDEHGQKIAKTAEEQGSTPKKLADRVVKRFQETWKLLHTSEDDFIRTTEERHKKSVQQMWQRIQAAGDIYLGSYEGLYCVADEAFYTEKEVIDGLSPTGRPVEKVQEPSYFFRLSRYQEKLLAWYRSNPDVIAPKERYNEIISFVEGGLNDLSISRTRVSWGVQVPDDPDHTIYVWLDALTNYISALGGPDAIAADSFWPATHLIGKDILRFHAVYWPAFLMSAGLPLPKKIFAHGWWTIEGEKMSKTTRNVVDPAMLVEEYGVDAVRYFLLREVPFGSDGDFSHKALIGRINADLANDLGNMVSRVSGMVQRFSHGHCQAIDVNQEVLAKAEQMHKTVQRYMTELAFHRALESIWAYIAYINQFIEVEAPWAQFKKSDQEALNKTLYSCLYAIREISLSLLPFIPVSSNKILNWLTEADSTIQFQTIKTELAAVQPLFPRIDEKEMTAKLDQVHKMMTTEEKTQAPDISASKFIPEAVADTIEFDAFMAIDLRAGKIIAAEDIVKSKKLLKLSVDIGGVEPRQIIAGIKQHYTPTELIDKKVVVVANLKPAKLMGLLSEGMILAASDANGLRLVDPGDALPGAQVK